MKPEWQEKSRTAALDEIRATAWKQIGESGASSLSLRGIAREMGVSAMSLYHYYKDRDALVTALLLEGFTSFRLALEAGRDAGAPGDHAGRLRAMCKAYFTWAAQNPQRYRLLFGTPIRGYLFAAEVGPAAQRSFLVLQEVIGKAYAAGKIPASAAPRLPVRLKSQYEALKKAGMPYDPVATHLALSVWSMMHGVTSLHLHSYLTGFLQDTVSAFVDLEIERLMRTLGLVA